MCRSRTLAIAVLVAVIVSAGAAAGGIQAGLTEVNGAALFAMQLGENADSSQYGIDLQANRLLTEGLSIGTRVSMLGTSTGSLDTFNLALYIQGTSYFAASGSVVPYLGAGVGLEYAKVTWDYDGWRDSLSDDDTEPGMIAYAGVKSFLSENVALGFEARYQALFEYMDYGTIGGYVGFSYFF